MNKRLKLIWHALVNADDAESLPSWSAPVIGLIWGVFFVLIVRSPPAISPAMWVLMWLCIYTGGGFLFWLLDACRLAGSAPPKTTPPTNDCIAPKNSPAAPK